MPSFSRLLTALACAGALVLGGSAPAIARSAASAAGGELEVSSSTARGRAVTSIKLIAWAELDRRSAPIAGVTISVPRGYAIDLGRAPGTEVGAALALLEDASGDAESATVLSGALVAEDPAAYAQDVEAQACAPGRHAAVWRVVQSSSPRLLVFADPAVDGSGGFTLRLCPVWPRSASAPGGLTANALLLSLYDVKAPAASGVYTWSVLVTPGDPATLAARPGDAFELRTVIPHPHTLTLRARHEPETHSVLLSGRLTAGGRPEAGISVTVTAYTGTYDFTRYGAVRTNADGVFSLRRAIDRTTVFAAVAYVPSRDCTAPSSAPGGCLGETVSPPNEPTTSLRIQRATDPKRAIRKRDAALARRAGLRRSDFPTGWESGEPSPFAVCEGFQPNLSDLTITGEASSPQFARDDAVAFSRASVFRSETQARTAFRRTARLEVARCLARDLRDAEFTVLQVGTLDYPNLGPASRGFRVIADYEQAIVYYDIAYLRRGRVVVELLFASLTQPLLNEEELAAKVAARADR
jgi:hypothetical protein